ncbi:MIP/aquaporin family protein [Brochothrix campestris]|uniref:Glycerol uptake facilitator related permease (Major Intrinsic protein family) n=1 Tax=Brochothrix campestris FSL F6-1037 TaxID=1265861 RepID=W7D533_9LIST|nr:MIP/aquaporin family protein [Brochothrix campestris]EUJ40368.1 glycerol uptake facilitator related permease (major Intrinsic protein family) [Brochothrix campestris FSL F6-1037]
MPYDLTTRLISELIGTALLIIIGNGAVANVELKGTKGNNAGWIIIALGYGFAVMMPALIFGGISGNHINPAFTIGLAMNDLFPWSEVLPYICAQLAGAFIGQLLVVAAFKPYYDQTKESEKIFATFATNNNANSNVNGFINEFIGSFILFFGAIGITRAPFFADNAGTAHLALGFLVCALVLCVGGSTGPALNPARDLMPRILHSLLRLKNKGSSQWGYSWVPVAAPILASIAAITLYSYLYL